MTPEELERLKAAEGKPDDAPVLQRQFSGVVAKAISDEMIAARTIPFIISTNAVDRMDDTIDAAGWKLENYVKNPVVLWAHSSRELPIGKNANVRIEGNTLRADTRFVGEDETTPQHFAFANAVFMLLVNGYLNAKSVGFRPLAWRYRDHSWGVDFLEQELLEDSVVPVPANPEALVEARSAHGIDTAPLARWASQVLDELPADDPIKRSVYEAAYKHAAAHPSYHPGVDLMGRAWAEHKGLIVPRAIVDDPPPTPTPTPTPEPPKPEPTPEPLKSGGGVTDADRDEFVRLAQKLNVRFVLDDDGADDDEPAPTKSVETDAGEEGAASEPIVLLLHH